MSRITPIEKDQAAGNIKPVFEQMQKNMGIVPNIFLNMANSPEALQGYLKLSELCGKTSLSKHLQEQLALVIAECNHCNYCLSAHSVIAKGVGLMDQEILNARKGHSQNPKDEAILLFAKSVFDKKGNISDKEIHDLKSHGVSDKELCEIMLILTLNFYTNYFNKIVNTEIDFPIASKL